MGKVYQVWEIESGRWAATSKRGRQDFDRNSFSTGADANEAVKRREASDEEYEGFIGRAMAATGVRK